MMRQFTLPLLLFTLALTSACERQHSVEKLMKDAKLREKVLQECANKGDEARTDQNCINAVTAQANLMPEELREMKKFYTPHSN